MVVEIGRRASAFSVDEITPIPGSGKKRQSAEPPPLGVVEFFGKRDIRGEFASQFVEEFRLHEVVVVGNVEGNDALALKGFREFAADAVQVGFLHDKDQVRPANVALRDHNPGVLLRADGADLVSRDSLEQLLRGKAAKPVSTADKEQLLD